MWLSGARSPLAPTLPCSGTGRDDAGVEQRDQRLAPAPGRTPLVGRSSTLARSSIAARTTSVGSGAPTPAA